MYFLFDFIGTVKRQAMFFKLEYVNLQITAEPQFTILYVSTNKQALLYSGKYNKRAHGTTLGTP